VASGGGSSSGGGGGGGASSSGGDNDDSNGFNVKALLSFFLSFFLSLSLSHLFYRFEDFDDAFRLILDPDSSKHLRVLASAQLCSDLIPRLIPPLHLESLIIPVPGVVCVC
jgi:hypothetical protein